MGSPLGPRTGTHEVAVPPPRCRPAGPARPTAPGAARPRTPAIPSRRFRGNSSWQLWKSRPRARGRTREPASRTRPSPLPGRCSPPSRRPRASARRVTLPGLHLRVVGYLPGVSDVARLLPRKMRKPRRLCRSGTTAAFAAPCPGVCDGCIRDRHQICTLFTARPRLRVPRSGPAWAWLPRPCG